MSDYDTVLERLITDPAFARALSADPERALAGYTLTDVERSTLAAGVSTDTGGASTVEQRTTKAGMVGVAGLVADLAGAIGGPGMPNPTPGDATIVEFTEGTVHRPVVVGDLWPPDHPDDPPPSRR